MIHSVSRPLLVSLLIAAATPRIAAADDQQPPVPPAPEEQPAPPPEPEPEQPPPPPSDDDLSPEAQAEFDAKVLEVEAAMSYTSADGSTQMTAGGGLFVGRDRRQIDTAQFLKLSNHPERLRKMKNRHRLRLGLMASGGVIAIVGLGYGVTAERCSVPMSDPTFEDCKSKRRTALYIGLGIAAVGGGVFAVGAIMSSKEPTTDELRKMADDYNSDLRTKLKAGGHAEATTSSSDWVLSPAVAEGGGGLVLSGAF